MGEKKEPLSHIPIRLNILFFIVFLFFAAIILRLAYVQLVEGEQYKHALEKYSTRELPIPAPRGRILDRNGEVLVSNKPVYTVMYVEEQNQSIDEEKVAEKLAQILEMPKEPGGTDKELLQLALELNASLPVAFGPEETNKLIAMIEPRLKQLPAVERISKLDNLKLLQTAYEIGLKVRIPFENEDREKIKNQLKATSPVLQKPSDLEDMTDAELLNFAIQSNMAIPLTLSKEEREDLETEVKAQLRSLPNPARLREETDMDLLRYAAIFRLDVSLPLTEEQRRFQWHKLNILKEMRSYHIASYIPRRVKVNISQAEMFKIVERRTELPGISVELEPIRQIHNDPDGSPIGTHILGYINAIRPEQVEEYKAQGYNPSDRVGENGLEKYYERYLRGKDGIMEVQVNKDSETVEKRMRRAPEPGNDLVLALDRRFQSRVEQILKEQIDKMRNDPKLRKDLKGAHALVMNPKTGEILAMASYPDYDLNLHYDREKFNQAYATQIRPYEMNHFINSQYEPGSTVKPISVMLALQEKLTTPNETIYDRGGLQVGNVFMRNWKLSGHGPVNARRALAVSNNTYMYTMAVRLANRAENYKDQFAVLDYYNAQFGLGVKTGVDLPYEKTGWESPYSYYGNLAHAFIGQYDLFTPMQLGQYVSTIANGGYRIRPHFVKEIRKGTTDLKQPGRTLMHIEPEVLNKIEIDPQWLKVAQEGMRMVTEPGGTAYWTFRGLPFSVAAKTGTAQTGRAEDNSLIVGYAPYEDPQVAFVVIVPEGGHGSDSSGPIAREILEAYHELYPGVLTAYQKNLAKQQAAAKR